MQMGSEFVTESGKLLSLIGIRGFQPELSEWTSQILRRLNQWRQAIFRGQ
jgi:hypothetical protein